MSNLSSRPPPVPVSGSKKYAVVALLLVVGIVVVFVLRGQGGTDARPAPPAASAPVAQQAAAPSNPKVDDVPPPPPEEEKPEAGPGGGTRIVYVHAGGCEAKCTGTAPPELGQALQVRGAQARRCYNSALAQDSSLKGHVTLDVRIGPTGNLCSATVASNDMGTPAVANCAANIFRTTASYPSPRGGCVDAKVPLSFVPQGQ